MSKELYIEEHERLIAEYLELHPDADETEAYEACSDRAYDAMRDRYADMADAARQRQKDER